MTTHAPQGPGPSSGPDDTAIFAIERPHPKLMKLYLLRSILSGPMIFLTLPLLMFRYQTLRYRFDEEGVAMQWGVLFRREINLTYARIQDIHLNAGFVQRFFGLADLMIQTASGSAGAEMTLEGLLEYEAVRDFLYRRMRGVHGAPSVQSAQASHAAAQAAAHAATQSAAQRDETVRLLRAIHADLAAVRSTVERRGGGDA